MKCERFFKYTNVAWDGHVVRIDFNNNFFARYPVNILMNMRNSSSHDHDLTLRFDDFRYKEFIDEIIELKRGDGVNFSGTVIGTDGGNVTINCFEIKRNGDHMEVQPHIHSVGRYADGKKVEKDKEVFEEIKGIVSDETVEIEADVSN